MRRLLTLLAGAILLAGCGSATPASATGAPAAAQHSAVPLERLYAGTDHAPPATGPTPPPGKKVWIVSCGQNASGCAESTRGAENAAALIGWVPTMFDGAFSPETIARGVRQAIAARADGLVLVSVDCATVSSALSEALAAGLQVVNYAGFHCGVEPGETGPRLVSTQVVPSRDARSMTEFLAELGRRRAHYVANLSNGTARVLNVFSEDVPVWKIEEAAFSAELRAVCPGCAVSSRVEISQADFIDSTKIQNKIASALVRDPRATVLNVPADALFDQGALAATRQSGRRLTVEGGEGTATGIGYIRSGEVAGELCFSNEWFMYAAIDSLNRAFHGAPPEPAGVGLRLVDATHNLPRPGAGYTPPTDFVAQYTATWRRNG